MKIIIAILFLGLGFGASAQITKASLQASGLTCSMCSKAVKEALEEIPFVEKVQVDIKNQRYNLSFKKDAEAEPDVLSKAVEDAGFSVASLQVTALVNDQTLDKDDHIRIGNKYFHFLNGSGKKLQDNVTFSLVDKGFVSDKENRKHSALSKMPCVKTGRTASCCTSEEVPGGSRVYHVII
jgi:copper chaperone CopZ